MDDLSGLDWTASQSHTAKKPPPMNPSSAFTALRPTPPISGRSTPLNGGLSNPPSKPATPANDSFSNLVSFGSSAPNKNLSLQEQKRRLSEQKLQQESARRNLASAAYGAGDESFWDNLGSGRSTPVPAPPPKGQAVSVTGVESSSGLPTTRNLETEEDVFAAFGSSTSATGSSHFLQAQPKESTGLSKAPQFTSTKSQNGLSHDEDDDIFGLNQLKHESTSHRPHLTSQVDEDDVLGLLGKPISEIPISEPPANSTDKQADASEDGPHQDKAIAELMDMGFPIEKARQALESTDSGVDVSAAVSWLLTQAHSETRLKARVRRRSSEASRDQRFQDHGVRPEQRRHGSNINEPEPTQSRDKNRRDARSHRAEDGPRISAEKDPTQLAAQIGNNFLKTAGSIWKTGTKKVQQAVQDFNSDSDSSQPKWLREPTAGSEAQSPGKSRDEDAVANRGRRRSSASKASDLATDEARMLESDRARPAPRKPARPRQETRIDSSADNSRDHSPAMPSRLRDSVPASSPFQHQPRLPSNNSSSKASLSRHAIEEQASRAYVSSARRRKPQVQPPISASEPDLLGGASMRMLSSRPSSQPSRQTNPPTPSTVRPAVPARRIPSVSVIALKASNSHREAGAAHFKRGDYPAARQSYTAALSHLPNTHPITIILLTNRALTSLKIGEPKIAISDADIALGVIGPSKGESEAVDPGNGESMKPMREFYGKALMSKAEALEQMERWSDAAAVWKEAVEGGHGGATSIQGRLRAEKTANPQPTRSQSVPVKKVAAAPRRSAMDDLSGKLPVVHAGSVAAVNRLRAANAAAERADDERFALADLVETKLTAWKGGKADNLRAFLSSLDSILWLEARWQKIGMAELVLPNKVKIQYMKGIAKVHPDKVRGLT